MKKRSKKQKSTKKYPEVYKVTATEQAEKFRRPLRWLNRLLDALIEILEEHLVTGTPLSQGTINLIDELSEYKKRAIREGFEFWFPESDHKFIIYYENLKKINYELLLAKMLSGGKRACKARLGRAERAKYLLIDLFPKFLTLPFTLWFWNLYELDKLLERVDSAVKFQHISQNKLARMIRRLMGEITLLRQTIGDAVHNGAGDSVDGMSASLDMMEARLQVLLEGVQQGDIDVNKEEDRRKIRRYLHRVRGGKYNAIRELGTFGGKSILDWYKTLFDIDYHIDNAADLWVDGHKLDAWDEAEAVRIIKKAELAKVRFIKLFPEFLNKSVYWYYEHLYHIDIHLEIAKDLLNAGQDLDALTELRKARRHKHLIEGHLETF